MSIAKYMNKVIISLVVMTGIMIIASGAMMLSGFQKYAAAKAVTDATPVVVPLIAMTSTPYTQDQYKSIAGSIVADPAIKIEAMPDKLVISSTDVKNELQWRRVISDVLALDHQLRTTKACGSKVSGCAGLGLMAEIVGSKQSFSLKN